MVHNYTYANKAVCTAAKGYLEPEPEQVMHTYIKQTNGQIAAVRASRAATQAAIISNGIKAEIIKATAKLNKDRKASNDLPTLRILADQTFGYL